MEGPRAEAFSSVKQHGACAGLAEDRTWTDTREESEGEEEGAWTCEAPGRCRRMEAVAEAGACLHTPGAAI